MSVGEDSLPQSSSPEDKGLKDTGLEDKGPRGRSQLRGFLAGAVIALVAIMLCAALLLGLFLVPVGDRNARLGFLIEKVGSRILERELVIGTIIEADIGVDTLLVAHDVTLANPSWASVPDFASARTLRLNIHLPSLWSDGPFKFSQLELDGASLDLDPVTGPVPNWLFWSKEQGSEIVPEQFPISIASGVVRNSTLHLHTQNTVHTLAIVQLSLQEDSPEQPVSLALEGAWGELPVSGGGDIGPLSALIRRSDLLLALEFSLGETTLTGRGSVDELLSLKGAQMELAVSSPSLTPALTALGITGVTDVPLDFAGSIKERGAGFALAADGTAGEFELHVEGVIVDLIALDGVDVEAEVKGPSLAEVGRLWGIESLSPEPFSVRGAVQRQGPLLRVLPTRVITGRGQLDLEGQLPAFPTIDGWQLTMRGEKFNLAPLAPLLGLKPLVDAPHNIRASVGSRENGVEWVELLLDSPASRLEVNGELGAAPDYYDSRFTVVMDGSDLSVIAGWAGIAQVPASQYSGQAVITYGAAGLAVDSGTVAIPGAQLDFNVHLDQFTADTAIALTAEMVLQDASTTLAQFGGAVENLPPLPVTASLQLGGRLSEVLIEQAKISSQDHTLSFSGSWEQPLQLGAVALDVALTSTDITGLRPLAEAPWHTAIPLDASGRASLRSGKVELSALSGRFGAANFDLEAAVVPADGLEGASLNLRARGEEFGALVHELLQADMASVPVPFSIEVDAAFKNGALLVQRLEALIEKTQVDGQFVIGDVENLRRGSGQLTLSGGSSERIAHLFGLDSNVPDSPYSLAVELVNSEKELLFDPVRLEWGDSDYSGSVALAWGDVPVVRADLRSRYVSLPFLIPNLAADDQQEKVQPATERSGEKSSLTGAVLTREQLSKRVIPDTPLDFEWLTQLELDFSYKAEEIFIRDDATSSVSMDIVITDGTLRTNTFVWDGSFASGQADIVMRSRERGVDVELGMYMQRFPVILMMGGEPAHDPEAFYRAKLKASGATLAQLARSADGVVMFSGGGGSLDDQGLELLLGDTFDEILTRLNPTSTSTGRIELVCHAGAFSLDEGVVSLNPGLVLRTAKLDIASAGRLNLDSERLNLHFNTKSRKGVGFSASKAVTPYFKIGGTLAYPRLALDVKGAAVSGGAAVATGGLSILAEGLWDRWVATLRNPCHRLVAQLPEKQKKIYRSVLEPPPS